MNDRSAASQHVLVEGFHLLFRVKYRHIHLIAHGSGQDIRDPVHHLHVLPVLLHNILMAHDKVFAVPQSCKGAEGVFAHRYGGVAEGDHISPDLVHVGAVGKVDHIRGKSAAGAHVHLQSHNVSLFAKALVVFQKAEKFKMNETALYAEAFYGGPACFFHIRL